MILDVTALAAIVRRVDVSATLRAFVAMLAPLFVLWNVGVVLEAVKIMSEWGDFGGFAELFEDGELLFAVAIIVLAVLGAFAPLGFIAVDWAARHASWRYLTAVIGSAFGAVLFTFVGAAMAALTYTLIEEELVESPQAARAALLALGAPLFVWLAAWLVAGSRRIRAVLAGAAILALVLLAVGFLAFLLWAEEAEPGERLGILVSGAVMVLLTIGVVSWLVRSIRLRILLSGDRPRSLLLGAFNRPRFLVRFAYLIGLPSSLWSLRAMGTAAFWAFIVSRPLVYVGFALAFRSEDENAFDEGLGTTATVTLAVLLVIAGHLAFHAGKRLAARRIWDPRGASDPRPPILFLRSFQDDQLQFDRPLWDLVGRWFDLWSFRRNADELLIDEIAQYGPVVALGQPGETRVPFGAARYYATHADWQAIITETARRAQAIVIVAGSSPGVLWEFELLANENLLDRAVLLFRPQADAREDNRRALELFPGGARYGGLLGAVPVAQLLAYIQTASGPALLTAAKPTAAAYVLALRAHVQKCDAYALASSEFADAQELPSEPVGARTRLAAPRS